MDYKRQNFKNGQVLDASHMIKIEDGILNNQEELDNIIPLEKSEIDYICSTVLPEGVNFIIDDSGAASIYNLIISRNGDTYTKTLDLSDEGQGEV